MSVTIQWCDGPTPSASRPPVMACAVMACRASATGCWACRGTTAVPSSMRLVWVPRRATMSSASRSFGICGIHAVGNPAASAQAISSSSRLTLREVSPRSGPIITPIFTSGLLRNHRLVRAGNGAYPRDNLVEGGASGEHRGGSCLVQLRDVAGRDGAADDDGDVARAGGTQPGDDLGGEGDVRAGEDGQADDGDVLLDGGRDDGVGLGPDAGEDDLEARVAQRPGDDFRAPVVAVEAGLGHEDPGPRHAR